MKNASGCLQNFKILLISEEQLRRKHANNQQDLRLGSDA